jgi:hypothetical protein
MVSNNLVNNLLRQPFVSHDHNIAFTSVRGATEARGIAELELCEIDAFHDPALGLR